ncbi:uroporphyrinogen-III C-methyltransferase [Massilia sp. PAMC28688]|uniref:uroporphyrinogen-III C-methyltransferase n=1 Tax=Massilia sp. PAMC28688 TaxID=2861283 RepID=UPI001C635CC7|nr:uroporphyrinogen-III C-methyltransferase [Massilia sp. PAMC28688]QYF93741.1 uroporphyrinogen-III C-methyltransferase [Massilia sp. PAMC28688]
MNDLPTLPDHNSKPAGTAPPYVNAAAPATMTDILQRPMTVAVIVIALLLAAHAWSTRNSLQKLRIEVANRLQKAEVVNTETAATMRSVQDLTRDLQAKLTVLDNRQLEAQSQQLALEQLYQDLSKNRDEWALAEIEQVLATASQQLQLAGNVRGALIALQNADRSLSRSDTPQFITIRRAIARDIEKLQALPALDLVGVALRIDNAIAQVDTLPLLSDEKPVLPARPQRARGTDAIAKGTAPAAPVVAVNEGYMARARATWNAWISELWDELRQLIRVRKVDTPEALMISPEQTYFLRENLKLRLLNARLALLSRNEAAFRADLESAQLALTRYFDTRAAHTQSVQALLRQVQANNVAIEMPSLADSLNAVRNYKSKP